MLMWFIDKTFTEENGIGKVLYGKPFPLSRIDLGYNERHRRRMFFELWKLGYIGQAEVSRGKYIVFVLKSKKFSIEEYKPSKSFIEKYLYRQKCPQDRTEIAGTPSSRADKNVRQLTILESTFRNNPEKEQTVEDKISSSDPWNTSGEKRKTFRELFKIFIGKELVEDHIKIIFDGRLSWREEMCGYYDRTWYDIVCVIGLQRMKKEMNDNKITSPVQYFICGIMPTQGGEAYLLLFDGSNKFKKDSRS